MADAICGIVATACLDVCAGVLLDFMSLRHACTETLFSCSCCPSFCRKDRIELPVDESPASGPSISESQSHHHQTTQQPQSQAPMQTTVSVSE